MEAGQSVVEDNVTRSHKSQRTTSLLEDLIVVYSVSAELENRNFRSEKRIIRLGFKDFLKVTCLCLLSAKIKGPGQSES